MWRLSEVVRKSQCENPEVKVILEGCDCIGDIHYPATCFEAVKYIPDIEPYTSLVIKQAFRNARMQLAPCICSELAAQVF